MNNSEYSPCFSSYRDTESKDKYRCTIAVGTKNPDKVRALTSSFQKLFPLGDSFSTVPQPLDVDHGIRNWRAQSGQPFGSKQTGFGALTRARNALSEAQEQGKRNGNEICYALASENGLLPYLGIPEVSQLNMETVYVAIVKKQNDLSTFSGMGVDEVVVRGYQIVTECTASEKDTPEEFARYMQEYLNIIMPVILKGEDLYGSWTRKDCNRRFGLISNQILRSRSDFTEDCADRATFLLRQISRAKEILNGCADNGFTASLNSRYAGMVWTRDLSYCSSSWMQRKSVEDVERLAKTLLAIGSRSTSERFPIVCLPDTRNEKAFLESRTAPHNAFVREKGPEHKHLIIESDDPKRIVQLKFEMAHFMWPESPQISFALAHYLQGTLENLTPGTLDSEIHFLRAALPLLKIVPDPTNLKKYCFAAAHILLDRITNTDEKLCYGADTRDIFEKIMKHASCRTNNVFAASVLERVKEEKILPGREKEIDAYLQKVQSTFFDLEENFLIDFLPTSAYDISEFDINNMDIPDHIKHLIINLNYDFLEGKEIDVMGLAQSILCSDDSPFLSKCVTEAYASAVLNAFEKCDSSIGVLVFVPISGTPEEVRIQNACYGRMCWPFIAWAVTRAAVRIAKKFKNLRERAIDFAERQRAKTMKFLEREWYALDSEKGVYAGGAKQQAWNAAAFLEANKEFVEFYSEEN